MKKSHFPVGSPESVIAHANARAKRGRKPSLNYKGERNPRLALQMAKADRLKTPLLFSAWIDAHPVEKQMIWRGAALHQARDLGRVEDIIRRLDPRSSIRVPSTHRSKSIDLPVVKIEVPSRGLTIYARDNFHNWAVTVECVGPVRELDTSDLDFSALNTCYFEGFERGGLRVYKDYGHNTSRFSFHYHRADIVGVIERIITGAPR